MVDEVGFVFQHDVPHPTCGTHSQVGEADGALVHELPRCRQSVAGNGGRLSAAEEQLLPGRDAARDARDLQAQLEHGFRGDGVRGRDEGRYAIRKEDGGASDDQPRVGGLRGALRRLLITAAYDGDHERERGGTRGEPTPKRGRNDSRPVSWTCEVFLHHRLICFQQLDVIFNAISRRFCRSRGIRMNGRRRAPSGRSALTHTVSPRSHRDFSRRRHRRLGFRCFLTGCSRASPRTRCWLTAHRLGRYATS